MRNVTALIGRSISLCGFMLLSTAAATATEVTGAGASLPNPIYSKWASAYRDETGVTVSYKAVGSTDGIKQIEGKSVAFGATDAPLSGVELDKHGLIQVPTLLSGVVPVINANGLQAGDLVLDSDILSGIYLGAIKSWDAPAIRKLNPHLKLPSQAIVPVVRAEGSGTTFLFSDYLAKANPDFKEKVGSGTRPAWPVGTGANSNDGVIAAVRQTPGAIGYVELASAKTQKLVHVRLVNAAGKTVSPVLATIQAAAAGADWQSQPGFGVILTNQAHPAAWPITGATFVLMHRQPGRPDEAARVVGFFAWGLTKGAKMAIDLDYAPLPENVGVASLAALGNIAGAQGKQTLKP